MAAFLVILGLLLLGVAIVAWHTRETFAHLLVRRPDRGQTRRVAATPAAAYRAEPDAFAHAPISESSIASPVPEPVQTPVAEPVETPVPAPVAANGSDPFAHAPALSELGGLQSRETRH